MKPGAIGLYEEALGMPDAGRPGFVSVTTPGT